MKTRQQLENKDKLNKYLRIIDQSFLIFISFQV